MKETFEPRQILDFPTWRLPPPRIMLEPMEGELIDLTQYLTNGGVKEVISRSEDVSVAVIIALESFFARLGFGDIPKVNL